jgi:hypothetical protein
MLSLHQEVQSQFPTAIRRRCARLSPAQLRRWRNAALHAVYISAGLALLRAGDASAQASQPSAPKEVEIQYAPKASMQAKSEYTELKFECSGEPPFRTMTCRFFQVSLHEPQTKLSEGDATAIANMPKLSPKERAQTVERIRAMCAKLDANTAQRTRAMQGQPAGRAKAVLAEAAHFRKFCECEDNWDCIVRISSTALPPRACTIQSFATNEIDFERTGRRSWVAKFQAGFCPSVATVMVLEHDKSSVLLWTLTQTRVGVVHEGEKLCEGIELNKPAIYSWEYSHEFTAGCSSFKFGW